MELDVKPRRNGNSKEKTAQEKAQKLHDHYGSWERAARRIGLQKNTLRDINKQGRTPTDEHKKRIDLGMRRMDIEHLLGLDAAGTGLQALTALQETDTSSRQEQIIERGIERLQEVIDLISLADIERMRNEICD